MRKNAPIRTALLRTPFSAWPYPMRQHTFDMLRTIRGKRIAEAIKNKDRAAKSKLVDLVLEVPPSLDDL